MALLRAKDIANYTEQQGATSSEVHSVTVTDTMQLHSKISYGASSRHQRRPKMRLRICASMAMERATNTTSWTM